MEHLLRNLKVSTNYVCYSCKTRCDDLTAQKEHYKSEWHRYNLKRGLAQLPSITLDEFNERYPQQVALAAADQPKSIFECEYCKKTFHSQKSFENHCASKKHLEKKKKLSLPGTAVKSLTVHHPKVEIEAIEDSEIGEKNSLTEGTDNGGREDYSELSADEEEWEDLGSEWEDAEQPVSESGNSVAAPVHFGPEDCLFCVNQNSAASVELNLEHMKSEHFFIVPFRELCTDVKALLTYLTKKIRVRFQCVWCGKRFQTSEGVLSHMKMKGHTEMCFLGSAIEEYVPFYDFSAYCSDSDSDGTDDEVESGDGDGDGDSDDNDDTGDADYADDDNGKLLSLSKGSNRQNGSSKDALAGCYSLSLPSGRTIGNRSLIRYYKQHFGPSYTGISIRSILRKNQRMANVMSQNRSLGWSGGAKEAKKRESRDVKVQHALQNKSKQKLACKANKLSVVRPSVVF